MENQNPCSASNDNAADTHAVPASGQETNVLARATLVASAGGPSQPPYGPTPPTAQANDGNSRPDPLYPFGRECVPLAAKMLLQMGAEQAAIIYTVVQGGVLLESFKLPPGEFQLRDAQAKLVQAALGYDVWTASRRGRFPGQVAATRRNSAELAVRADAKMVCAKEILKKKYPQMAERIDVTAQKCHQDAKNKRCYVKSRRKRKEPTGPEKIHHLFDDLKQALMRENRSELAKRVFDMECAFDSQNE